MHDLLNKIPFLRIFFPFILGVVLSITLNLNNDLLPWIILSYFLILVVYCAIKFTKKGFGKFIFGVLIHFLLFIIGVQSCYLRQANNEPIHYSNCNFSKETILNASICDIPQLKEKSIKAKIRITQFKNGNTWLPCKGEVYAYFPKGDSTIYVGKQLVCKNKLTLIPEPKNPYEFNYKSYLYYKNIYHQLFLKPADYKVSSTNSNWSISEYPLLLKAHLLSVLKQNNLSDNNLAVTSALLLGYDDDISKDLLGAYSRTGTLHVLSVSGLHVGVLFMILNFLIRLPNKRFFVILKTLIIFICIWFYAALTGMSPSVVRSAAMFSFILIGTAINKKGNIYNTLLSSAFLILLFDPFLIIDVGFQLSYLAVGGIVFFYPYVSNWIVTNNKYINSVWKMTAVSISAQIITLPLTLYYFGQFPTLFFLANLIVIPLSYVVMFGSMLLVCLAKIKFLALFFSTIVNWSVIAMNEVTLFLDKFKIVNISDLNTSFVEMILMFMLLCSLSIFVLRKNYFAAVFSSLILVFLISTSLFNRMQSEPNKLIVYHIGKTSAIDVYSNSTCSSLLSIVEEKSAVDLIAKPGRIKAGIRNINYVEMKNGYYELRFSNKIVGLLLGDTLGKYQQSVIQLDYLVISNNSYCKGIDKLSAKTIIVDGSNSYKTINYLKKKAPLNCWITKEQGAYVVND